MDPCTLGYTGFGAGNVVRVTLAKEVDYLVFLAVFKLLHFDFPHIYLG